MKQILIFTLFAALFTVTSCSRDAEPGVNTLDGRTALSVTGGINVQARAHDKVWDANDQIGIYMRAAGTQTILEGAKNIPYKTTSGDGNFIPVATTIYFPVDGSNVDFLAWYPYQAVEEEWTADLTDQSSQAAIDLMVAHAKSNPQSGGTVYNKNQPQVKLNFIHRLSKLEVHIAPGTGITPAELSGLKVEITNQCNHIEYTPDYDAFGYEKHNAVIPLLTKSDGTFAEAILCPNDNSLNIPEAGRQLVFTLTAPDKVFRWDIPANKSFNLGEKNIYNITINSTALNVTSEIVDWTVGNNGGEPGSAE